MKASDVDLKHIKELLASVPEAVEVDSIQFIGNQTRILFSAGDEQIKKFEYEESLKLMNEILAEYKIRENKNYLLASDVE